MACVTLLNRGYNEQRNICSDRSGGVRYVEGFDRVSVIRRIWHRITGRSYEKLLHTFGFPGRTSGDLIHTFNGIVIGGSSRWVVSFETSLPREQCLPKWLVRTAWRKLAARRCVRIIALSESARFRMLDVLSRNEAHASIAVTRSIREKIEVLHPPQEELVTLSQVETKHVEGCSLRLVLVGHDFYRKGGLEVLMAVDALLGEGKDVQLSIVGRMAAGDYASRAGSEETSLAEEMISRHSSRIIRIGSIPGEEVYQLLGESHILCLPTWGETYGYSVLEGQACGCAAITTDLRALPEINNADCGWVIPVPKLPNGDGDLDTDEKRRIFRAVLVSGLKRALGEAYDDRSLLRGKAIASMERIRKFHDPSAHARRLKEIYDLV